MDITSYLNSLEDCREALIRFRRDLHRHPEPGWKEFYTTARLIAALKDHGIPAKYGKEILHRDYLWGYPPQKELDVCMERAVSQGADAGIIKEMENQVQCWRSALISTATMWARIWTPAAFR